MNRAIEKAAEIIKPFEGFSPTIYICPAGYKTFGYGTVLQSYQKIGFPINKLIAEFYLLQHIKKDALKILNSTKVDLNENQFAAILSFVYNLGFGAFQHSTLRMKLNRGDYKEAADEFLKWNKCRVNGILTPLKGLTRRRHAERHVFLSNSF